MAGCFGNDPYDRYVERQLDEYLKGFENNEFEVSGTITYIGSDGNSAVENVSDDGFETRYEASNEVRDHFIERWCADNGIHEEQIEDCDLTISPDIE